MGFSDEIKRLVELKVERLESIPDAFANRMVAIQRAKFSEVLSLLDELDYSNGSIVVSQSNLLKIEQITEQVKEVLTSGEFETVVGELLNEFDEQAAITYKYFDASFDAFEIPTIANEILAQKKREAVIDLLNSTDQYLTNPMRQGLSNAVTTGASRKDVISLFKLLIEGDENTVGRLERSTRQIVSDTFALNDRAITNEVAKQIKADWFLYTGGLLKTTRPFCKSRNGKFYRRSDVESWGELEDWDGRMAGTDEKTIFVTAGGYNCQHSILPVSESVVPNKFKTQSESDVNIDISNKSGFDVNINELKQHAQLKSKEYGLTSDIGITIKKANSSGGSVGWGLPNKDGVLKFQNHISIETDGTLSISKMKQVINHEAKHLQQSQTNKMFLKKNDSNRWAIFWEGKEFMRMDEYTKITKRMSNPRTKYATRLKALREYVNLPWELEAHLADGDAFNSLLK